MNAERIVRIVAGTFVLLSLALGVESQPRFRQQILLVLYCICRTQFVPKRLHQVLPAGQHTCQTRCEKSVLIECACQCPCDAEAA